MTVTLTGTGGLFTILKLAVTASINANTNHGTTIPANIESILAEQGDLDTVDGAAIAAGLTSAARTYRSTTSIPQSCQRYAESLIVDRVVDDAPETPDNIEDCINELIRQMIASSDTVKENVVSVVVTPPDANAPTLAVSTVDQFGCSLETLVDEDLIAKYLTTLSVAVDSGPAQQNLLAYDWPTGSNVATSLSVADEGILPNQSFDEDTSVTNLPDNWIAEDATIGTTVQLTESEIQDITLTGSPSSGWWTISHTNNNGDKQTTIALSHNASAGDVEAALASFVGWSDVSVTYATQVWTVNFNAVQPPGDQGLLTVDNNLDAGTFNVTEDTAGESSYEYKALAILGDATTETTTLRLRGHDQSIIAQTVYGISLQAKKVATTTGTLYLECVDGAGTLITNDEGTNLQLAIDMASLSSTAFEAQTTFWQMPTVLPEIWYIQLRLGADLATGLGVYLDDLIMTPATQLYTNGPYAALFANHRELVDDDRYTIAVSNSWAGKIQSWFYRWFQRLLPSDTSGAETITDP